MEGPTKVATLPSNGFSHAVIREEIPINPIAAGWKPPSSDLTPMCHPCVEEVTKDVDEYFLENWNFSNDKARRTFINAGFSQVTCLYFPLAKFDRIHFACRLLTVLFLIDDLLEEMSFEEGEAYNAKLIPIARGDTLPDRSVPAQFIFYDLWQSMRACDKELANAVLEPTFTFMSAQTDKVRKDITELNQYLEYREKDVGKALLSALMRFSMALTLTPAELEVVKPLEANCSKQISIVNDICSWEKELRASQTLHQEGAVLCSAVKVLADSTGLGIESAKRVLWVMAREWEVVHERLVAVIEEGGCSDAVRLYVKGLEYQMSGNERWSQTTLRYHLLE